MDQFQKELHRRISEALNKKFSDDKPTVLTTEQLMYQSIEIKTLLNDYNTYRRYQILVITLLVTMLFVGLPLANALLEDEDLIITLDILIIIASPVLFAISGTLTEHMDLLLHKLEVIKSAFDIANPFLTSKEVEQFINLTK